jgi:hypothetical protein
MFRKNFENFKKKLKSARGRVVVIFVQNIQNITYLEAEKQWKFWEKPPNVHSGMGPGQEKRNHFKIMCVPKKDSIFCGLVKIQRNSILYLICQIGHIYMAKKHVKVSFLPTFARRF